MTRFPHSLASSTKAQAAENLVANLLKRQGWTILARNFRRIGCELDLVAQKGETLAVVEVKARSRLPANESDATTLLPARKRASLERGAAMFLTQAGLETSTLRFDLAIVVPQSTGRAPLVKYYVQVI